MRDVPLFRDSNNRWLTGDDITAALRSVGAADCDVLYIHTGMNFGIPNPELSRRQLLEELWNSVRATNVRTLVLPAFTFSFCNGKEYDIRRSRSAMGALNEYVRSLPETVRSADPLMSVVVEGHEQSLVQNLPPTSLGPGSVFDRLHAKGSAARFAFLGVDPAQCFTYIHYVEKTLDVPYRYDRAFEGTVVDENDHHHPSTWILYVRYAGVEPARSSNFPRRLADGGSLRRQQCGDAVIGSIAEADAYAAFAEMLRANIDSFLEFPYPRGRNDTSFHAENMVAL